MMKATAMPLRTFDERRGSSTAKMAGNKCRLLLPRSPQPLPVPALKPAVLICKIGAKTQNGVDTG